MKNLNFIKNDNLGSFFKTLIIKDLRVVSLLFKTQLLDL